MQELVRLCKALANENRIRMLKLLLDRDVSNCEMALVFPNLSQSQISRDLSMLMDVSCLRRWREGRCVVYTVDKAKCNEFVRALLGVLAESFSDDEVMCRDMEELQKAIDAGVREPAK